MTRECKKQLYTHATQRTDQPHPGPLLSLDFLFSIFFFLSICVWVFWVFLISNGRASQLF